MTKEKFKYDVIHKTSVDSYDKLPKFFFADNPIDAEKLYFKFKKLLNSISYSYAISTGIPKSDLFGEALLGLAKANCDWDNKRSDCFRTYAIFRIKDVLNEYVRKNSQIITIPSYIKKANTLLNRIKGLLEKFEIGPDDIYKVINTSDISSIEIPYSSKETCKEMLSSLNSAAIRAGVEYEAFVKRVEYLPIGIDLDTTVNNKFQETDKEQLRAAIMVGKLKKYMNKNELLICNGIMKDLTYKEIGRGFEKSDAWVGKQLKNLKKKLLARIKRTNS